MNKTYFLIQTDYFIKNRISFGIWLVSGEDKHRIVAYKKENIVKTVEYWKNVANSLNTDLELDRRVELAMEDEIAGDEQYSKTNEYEKQEWSKRYVK